MFIFMLINIFKGMAGSSCVILLIFVACTCICIVKVYPLDMIGYNVFCKVHYLQKVCFQTSNVWEFCLILPYLYILCKFLWPQLFDICFTPHLTKNKNKLYEHNWFQRQWLIVYSDQQCCIHIDDKSLDDFKAVLCILL